MELAAAYPATYPSVLPLALCEAPQMHQLYVSYLRKRGLSLVSMATEALTDEQLIPLSTLDAAAAVGILSHSETEAKALDEAMAKFESISLNAFASSHEEMVSFFSSTTIRSVDN